MNFCAVNVQIVGFLNVVPIIIPYFFYRMFSASVLLKGTVSLDIGLHFSFWKIKLVLSAKPLMVLTFFYFVVPEIFKNFYLNCFFENAY